MASRFLPGLMTTGLGSLLETGIRREEFPVREHEGVVARRKVDINRLAMADSVAVESLHSFVLRVTKCSLVDLDAPGSSGLPGAGQSHSQEQRWLPHHHPLPNERPIIAEIRSCHLQHVVV